MINHVSTTSHADIAYGADRAKSDNTVNNSLRLKIELLSHQSDLRGDRRVGTMLLVWGGVTSGNCRISAAASSYHTRAVQ